MKLINLSIYATLICSAVSNLTWAADSYLASVTKTQEKSKSWSHLYLEDSFNSNRFARVEENMLLVKFDRPDPWHKYHYGDSRIRSLEEEALNVGGECPIILKPLEENETIILTCCFHAISVEAKKALLVSGHIYCPLCSTIMLTNYVRVETGIPNSDSFFIGFSPQWTVAVFKEYIGFKKEKYHNIKRIRSGYTFLSDEKTLEYYLINCGNVIFIAL